MKNDTRWLLRERTAAAHAEVDAAIGDFADLAGYLRYLKSLYAFRAPIERSLRAKSWPLLSNFAVTALGDHLARDIADLGAVVPATDALDIDLHGARLLGVLYVLEGSALGANILYKRAQALGFHATFGARHLAAAVTSGTWPRFLELMAAEVDLDVEQATVASLATFEAARTAFARASA